MVALRVFVGLTGQLKSPPAQGLVELAGSAAEANRGIRTCGGAAQIRCGPPDDHAADGYRRRLSAACLYTVAGMRAQAAMVLTAICEVGSGKIFVNGSRAVTSSGCHSS
ncbi:hypothetical protein [Streptomyces antibioticus]|uniref:Uncharacterized protein n=1 Tax=Streptomyces antibioticus TaxID=1890 RepID=A0AAE7CPK9_STRAT|nr:hypothetical protein HCX60_33465 [Streptomyces antibioticus]